MSTKNVRQPSSAPREMTYGEYEALVTQLSEQDRTIAKLVQANNEAFKILENISQVLVLNGIGIPEEPEVSIALPGTPEFDASLRAVPNPNPLGIGGKIA